jgi:hypothetical protein
MTRKPERKPDDPAQYKRFVEAARKAEADETEDGADRAFIKVARPGPPVGHRPEARSGVAVDTVITVNRHF